MLTVPLDVGGRPVRYRFPRQRSGRLANALPAIEVSPPPTATARGFRSALMEISGIGPKTDRSARGSYAAFTLSRGHAPSCLRRPNTPRCASMPLDRPTIPITSLRPVATVGWTAQTAAPSAGAQNLRGRLRHRGCLPARRGLRWARGDDRPAADSLRAIQSLNCLAVSRPSSPLPSGTSDTGRSPRACSIGFGIACHRRPD